MPRSSLAAFAMALAAFAGAAVTGCSAGGPASASGSGPAATASTAPGTAAARGTGTAPGAAAATGRSGSASWVLTAPATVDGLARFRPPADDLARLTASLDTLTTQLGITGSMVEAVYDDPAKNAYVVVAGLNGTGYDPAALDRLAKVPSTTDDGAGDRVTSDWSATDAGPHGGRAGCQETLVRSGWMASDASDCVWLTPTTFGLVTLYPKVDGGKLLDDAPAGVVGPVMRQVRAAVEHDPAT
ncbi:hypothetical protein POF50_018135 [Streptomyces sp. SL13]|uniref:DUF3558 domain-containing protein n=1 Tax=Streptantibioticus silvisoli TaxID=2705255 RepID=A0AA90H5Z3_9ACTN|nr:hypothetical protein [Streptantibioticus silvisoli]MDI5962015.1 hypothetical protein [Streptantibioticus silvisoli]MDI5971239.1 hypothetical protein [Streptantibioticus silvisoli]